MSPDGNSDSELTKELERLVEPRSLARFEEEKS